MTKVLKMALLAGMSLPCQQWQAGPKTIMVPDDNGPDTRPPNNAVKTAPVGMPKTVRIVLEDNDSIGPTGQTFGLNGVAFNIRPGEEVDVPMGIIEILNNAVESRAIKEPQTLRVVGYRPVHRFPYRVIHKLAEVEVEAA